jgi:hypothetical protein
VSEGDRRIDRAFESWNGSAENRLVYGHVWPCLRLVAAAHLGGECPDAVLVEKVTQ